MSGHPETSGARPTVLVTGATGFLGKAVAQKLEAAGFTVRLLVRSYRSTTDRDAWVGDIRDLSSLLPAMAGVDAVVHCAGLAHRPRGVASEFFRVNADGALNVAEAAGRSGVTRLVLVSTIAVPPDSGGVVGFGVAGADPYGESKSEGERRTVDICSRFGITPVILRMATLYGEGDPGNVRRLILAVRRGRFLWIGHGENRKSLLHRDDAARACLLALRASAGTYGVSAPAAKMREIIHEISAAVDRPVPNVHVPASLALAIARTASHLSSRRGPLARAHSSLEKWLSDVVVDVDPFRREVGFEPLVTLREGIRREVEWLTREEAIRP